MREVAEKDRAGSIRVYIECGKGVCMKNKVK